MNDKNKARGSEIETRVCAQGTIKKEIVKEIVKETVKEIVKERETGRSKVRLNIYIWVGG